MPKKKKSSKEELDKEYGEGRPSNSLTFGSFLAASLDKKLGIESGATAECEAETPLNNETKETVPTANQATCASGEYRIKKSKKGNLPISYESRSKGKKVTVISNVSGDLNTLLSELKKAAGCGGVARETCVELQGDRREFLAKYLKGHTSVK